MGLFGTGWKRYGGCPRTEPVRKEKYNYALSQFEIFETLGTGTFGRVRLVRCMEEDSYYALKMVKKEYILKMDQLDHMCNEVRLLRILQHPFIVDLRAHFQDELRLYLLMELVIGGELYALLRNSGKLSNDRAKFYAAEVVLAFQYLHGMYIAYRGLKPENVLIDVNGNIKLCDFGFAKVVEERTFTNCGTPEYTVRIAASSRTLNVPGSRRWRRETASRRWRRHETAPLRWRCHETAPPRWCRRGRARVVPRRRRPRSSTG